MKEKKDTVEQQETDAQEQNNETTPIPTCGIVMPISAIDGCTFEHWAEVKSIIEDAVNQAGFKPNLVSDADDVGVIQNRIISNLL